MSNEATKDPREGWTSASNAAADGQCKGRHLAQKGLVSETSPDAAFGNVVHEALAKRDPSGLTTEQEGVYESCVEIEQKLLVQTFGSQVEGLKTNPIAHRRFWIGLEGNQGTFKHSGEADCIHRLGTRILIIDWKTLAGDQVESAKNEQLRDLAVLVWNSTPLISEVVVAIVQPLVTHSPETCLYEKDDLQRSMKLMIDRVVASNTSFGSRAPGEVQCKHCLAAKLGKCKENEAWRQSSLPATFEPLPLTGASEWTPAQRSLFLERRKVAQSWLDEREKEIRALLESDHDAAPGWGFKEGRNMREVTDVQGAFDRFSTKGGSLPDYLACVDVGLTKLKERLKAVTKLKGKALDKAFDELLSGLTTTKQAKPSLVRLEEGK